MTITWKQRLSRILGAYTLGVSSGLTISLMDSAVIPLLIFNCIAGGLVTALPQVKCVLDDYAKKRS